MAEWDASDSAPPLVAAGSAPPSDEAAASATLVVERLRFREARDAKFREAYDELSAVARRELDVEDLVLDQVDRDIEASSWWGAVRDTATERVGSLYAWFKSVVIGASAAAALVSVSDGPTWLIGLFLGSVVLVAVAPPRESEVWLFLGLVGVLGTGIALLAQTTDRVNVWEGLLAVLVAALIGLTIAVAADLLMLHVVTSVTADVVMLLGTAAGAALTLRSLPTDGWPLWIDRGVTAGLAVGLLAGAMFALMELLYRLVSRVIDGIKMRRHAEAEFVQSCLWALGGLATLRAPANGEDPPHDGSHFYDEPWSREETVYAAQYLTSVLEQHVTAALAREDRAGHAYVAREIARRAAVLRSHKRAMLLGRPNAVDEFATTLRTAAAVGAMRCWHELPTLTAEEEADARPARTETLAKVLHRVILLAIPVALAGYGWVSGEPTLLTSGAIWVAVVAVDMLAPGTRKEVAELAGDTRGFLPGARGGAS